MIRKLFWLAILMVVMYTVAVLYTPTLADPIGEKIGVSGYNVFVKSFKGNLDQISTDIPSKNEFIEGGKAAYSGAIDIKDTVIITIGTTKETIDTVRGTLSGAESTYNDAKETFDKAKGFVEGTTQQLQNVKDTLDDVSQLGDNITNLVDTENVNQVIEDTQ